MGLNENDKLKKFCEIYISKENVLFNMICCIIIVF